jgi:hypothetical protein
MIIPTAAAILEQLADKDAQVLNLLARCRTEPYLGVWLEGPELIRRFARLLRPGPNSCRDFGYEYVGVHPRATDYDVYPPVPINLRHRQRRSELGHEVSRTYFKRRLCQHFGE